MRAVLRSLLAGLLWLTPARAAEQIEVRLDGLRLPIDLVALEAWSASPDAANGDLRAWLDLLDPRGREQLRRILRAPLVQDRSFAQQFLASWAGQRVLEELDQLISTEQGGSAGPLLYQALQELLARQPQVTTIELLRAVPSQSLVLHLDGGLELAGRWRRQIEEQRDALQALQQLRLRQVSQARLALSSDPGLAAQPQRLLLPVPHRHQALELQVWPASRRSWVLLSPGLGGSAAQLAWLAAGLQQRGWPVLLLDHPGSDERAVRELLEGRRPPPGAETLSDRVLDLQAVVRGVEQGPLPRLGDQVVLVGHSLGGLSSLLAAGLRPEAGLARRCDRALDGIPLTNLSRLLQCQLLDVRLPAPQPLAQPLQAVVSLNGFGSLLWPHRGLQALPAPVLLVGGSLDLITPPLGEQLQLFLGDGDHQSRLVLLEGGSHFSPVRIDRQEQALFQLGEEFVGVEPLRVQALTLGLTADFLGALPKGVPPQRRQLGGVTAYVLNRRQAETWSNTLRN
ncbi:alpha/beta hydrolase [Synechococcus sp. HK05]|nr:alpha/beta hydrolase [Synechococcus sp. HK05]MBV2351636.1 alpha/beta hydrolase [Synechococcus sp. HK05]